MLLRMSARDLLPCLLGISGSLLWAGTGCKPTSPMMTPSPAAAAAPAPKTVRIVATASLHGTTEPCGCTSDPLGDLARIAGVARGGLWLDAGDLLYDADPPARGRRAQADLKAGTISRVYEAARAESALGPSDLYSYNGAAKLALPRQACNAASDILGIKDAAPVVREVSGLRVGVFGVVDPARYLATRQRLPLHERATPAPPEAAATGAQRAVDKLKTDGAEIVVALLAMNRAEARKVLLAAPGIDFGIIGLEVEDGMPEAEPVGQGWLLAPADQGRRVALLEIIRRDAPSRVHVALTQFAGEAGRAREAERIAKRRAALEAQLRAWRADPSADASFIAARQAELDALLKAGAPAAAAPPPGPYFTYALVPIKRALPRDPAVADALKLLDREIGRTNLAAAANEPPPPADAKQATYVGDAACVRCHKTAAAFWQKTQHARAWQTLVTAEKQYNYDCIGCHVTGWQQPGGSNLGTVEKRGLVNVQCEVCHGPGSKHVAEDGMDEPKTMAKSPPDDLCRGRCHTTEHSDTFDLVPYLRDVLGAGHGEERRKALGDGPTAHELKAKATAEAKK